MLSEILAFLHNYFVLDSQRGTFAIMDGFLSGCSLHFHDGQRIMVSGSGAWDGVWTWHTQAPLCDSDDQRDTPNIDEEFTGAVHALGVPHDLLKKARDIRAWTEANAKTLNSPFQSESFNGYSYNKGTNSSGGAYDWQTHFGADLFKRWGKIG